MTMHPEPLRIFVGYDPREAAAYDVCVHSLRRHASVPLAIEPLNQPALRRAGLYRRTHELGARVDTVDGKPFSTEFSFTRFLVPALAGYRGWALFVDCDFLFMADVAELFALADDRKAVMCVHHDYRPAKSTKMDGCAQEPYHRKNWSSLMLWNCGHDAHQGLMVDHVSLMPGAWLHGLHWIRDVWQIGALPEVWNWLDGHSSLAITPKAVHYTRGCPCMPGWENVAYSDEWRAEHAMLQAAE